MKYLFLLIPFIPSLVFAQNNLCQKTTPEYHLNFVETPLKYNYSLSAKQLSAITTKKEASDINSYVLGTYKPEWSSDIKYSIKSYQDGRNKCEYVSKIELKLELQSTIHISKDVLPFSCSTKRVLAHEQMHYQIERSILEFMKKESVFLMKKYFNDNPISYNNNINLNNYIKNKYHLLFKDFENYRKTISEPYHAKIDTPENYKYESTVCGQEERRNLHKIILKN